jgi:hypothetical protein
MMPALRGRALPGVIFATLVILLAIGNSWVGLYPFGSAVWIRPLFGTVGIIGAMCLMFGNPWWRILLPVWCVGQSFIVATDVSGEWFSQGIKLGFSEVSSEAVHNSQLLTQYSAHGLDSTGLLLLIILAVVAIFRLHPKIRRSLAYRWPVVAMPAIIVLAVLGYTTIQHYYQASATYVLDLDLPNVPIYYKDQLLGRTPLRVTPQRIADWGLPLNPAKPVTLEGFGWADCAVLSDGTTTLPLYAGTPWPFAGYLDEFDSPWGMRCRFHVGGEDGNRRIGYLYPTAERRNEPILKIQTLDAMPIAAGGPLRIKCVLNNPTSTSYAGRLATIERYCFSYETRNYNNVLPPKTLREIDMPPAWNTLSPGQTLAANLMFEAPTKPGDYELFCTWFLYDPQENSNSGPGSCYSNMLRLIVK